MSSQGRQSLFRSLIREKLKGYRLLLLTTLIKGLSPEGEICGGDKSFSRGIKIHFPDAEIFFQVRHSFRLSAESPPIRMAPEVEEESGEYCLSWNGYNEQLSVVFRELCKVRKSFSYFSLSRLLASRSNFSWMSRWPLRPGRSRHTSSSCPRAVPTSRSSLSRTPANTQSSSSR